MYFTLYTHAADILNIQKSLHEDGQDMFTGTNNLKTVLAADENPACAVGTINTVCL